jgi:hypothetical protein
MYCPKAERKAFADRVGYEGSSAHKADPWSWGLEQYRGRPRDRTYCDLHAKFMYEDRHRIPRLMRRGIMAGPKGGGSITAIRCCLLTHSRGYSLLDSGTGLSRVRQKM